jgi:hypothetical protein
LDQPGNSIWIRIILGSISSSPALNMSPVSSKLSTGQAQISMQISMDVNNKQASPAVKMNPREPVHGEHKYPRMQINSRVPNTRYSKLTRINKGYSCGRVTNKTGRDWLPRLLGCWVSRRRDSYSKQVPRLTCWRLPKLHQHSF